MKKWVVILCSVAAVILSGGAHAERLAHLAQQAFNDGFYDVALRQAEDALRRGVTATLSNQLLFLAGRCQLALGYVTNAVEVLQLVRADAAEPCLYADALYWLGTAYEQVGDAPRALFSYEAALSEPHRDATAVAAAIAAARMYLRRDEALRAYLVLSNVAAAVTSAAPESLLFAQGQAALACRQFADAQALLEAVLATTTDVVLSAHAACALGAVELASGAHSAGVARLVAVCTDVAPPLAHAIARYYLAHAALRSGATNEAREWLLPNVTKFSRAVPEHPAVSMREGFPYADSLLLLGQLEMVASPVLARRWLTRCVVEYPNAAVHDRAVLALALLDAQEGAWHAAQQRLSQLAPTGEQDVRVASLLLAGDVARATSNFAQAVELYLAAATLVSNEPAELEARLRAAAAAYEAGNYAVAAKECEQLIARAPAPLLDDAYLWGAWSFLAQGMLQEAQARLVDYLRRAPTGRHAYLAQLQLGRIAMELGELERAEQHLRALATNTLAGTRAAEALYEFAWVAVRQQRIDDAIEYFAQLQHEFPDSPLRDDAAFHIGELLFNRHAYEDAERAFLAALRHFTNTPQASAAAYWAATAAYRRGAYEVCMDVLSNHWELLAASRYGAEAQLLRGDCLASLGDFHNAYRAYHAASVHGTGTYVTSEARLRMGDCLLALTNVNAAISLFSELTESRRPLTRARALVGLGEARRLAGDPRGALSEWLRVLYDYREFAAPAEQALNRAARLYEALNEPERARQLYRLHGTMTGTAGPFAADVASSANNP